ncbi:MAG TPA: VTT domain-containing protein [Methanoregula sp.]|nr:VTT domain-containing protein [Methanoregula sp.]
MVAFSFVDLVLHFDKILPQVIQQYGLWTYAILFLILFCETGLVVTPFLPGDSLLFIAGTLAGTGILDIRILLVGAAVAVILGNTTNYWIGYTFELKVLEWRYSIVKKEHLAETHQYFEKYGGFTIVVARFVPVIRTFAPFIAGIGRMPYRTFLLYNIVGAVAWVCLFLIGGFLFGNLPFVQQNFSLIVYAIIAVSFIAIIPVIVRFLQSMKKGTAAKQN